MSEPMVMFWCECKAANFVFLGDPNDLSRTDDLAYECWNCKKTQLMNDEETTRELFGAIDPDEDIMNEVLNNCTEGHRFALVKDWVEPFLDSPFIQGETEEEGLPSIRGVVSKRLNYILGKKASERKKWMTDLVADPKGPDQGTYDFLRQALAGDVVKASSWQDEESLNLALRRSIEAVLERLLYLEGHP